MNLKKIIMTGGFALTFFAIGFTIEILWETTDYNQVVSMIDDDSEKILKSKRKDVFYDYQFTSFKMNSKELWDALNKLKANGAKLLVIKFGFNTNENGKFSDFTMAFSGIDANNLFLSPVFDIAISKWDSNISWQNYNKAFNKLRKSYTYGHRHEFDDGVSYSLNTAMHYLTTHPAEVYYFYPAFKKNPLFEFNFSTVIITNEPELRKRINEPESISINIDDFFGDKGQTCCQ